MANCVDAARHVSFQYFLLLKPGPLWYRWIPGLCKVHLRGGEYPPFTHVSDSVILAGLRSDQRVPNPLPG
jgi:hypothetical protein